MKVVLQFKTPGYICDPFRVEMFKLIEIKKQSGLLRARSEKKRRECLEQYLRSAGLTLAQYEKLEAEALEPFYKDAAGFIYIPAGSIFSCLVNANSEASSRLRIDNLRVALRIDDFRTDKKKPDGVWERFAVVKSGAGKTLSNQRGLRSNAFLRDFTAAGTIDFDPEMVKPAAVVDLLTFAGRSVGIGASRKMGYGRFEVAVSEESQPRAAA